MTIEQIQQRRADLVAHLEKTQQEKNAAILLEQALGGAIQDCDFWLSKFVPEAQPQTVPENGGTTLLLMPSPHENVTAQGA